MRAAAACGGEGLKQQTMKTKVTSDPRAPPSRQMSWFSGSGERPRRSQSRVLSNDDGNIFLIESELATFLNLFYIGLVRLDLYHISYMNMCT